MSPHSASRKPRASLTRPLYDVNPTHDRPFDHKSYCLPFSRTAPPSNPPPCPPPPARRMNSPISFPTAPVCPRRRRGKWIGAKRRDVGGRPLLRADVATPAAPRPSQFTPPPSSATLTPCR